MHSPPKLSFDLCQLGAKSLHDGSPLNLKPALSGLPAGVREPQKVEGFRFAQTALAPPLLCEATKLDQASFLRVQFQAKLGKPLPQGLLKLLSFLALFKSHHDVVNVSNEADIAPRVTLTPLVSPQVKHIMKVDVGRQR
jgi:hypothetical protein